jgi:hypothetical protein
MLQKISSRTQECYRHADKARKRASECRDRLQRREFLDMAERWMKQAHRYEYAKRGLKRFRKSAGPHILSGQLAAI